MINTRKKPSFLLSFIRGHHRAIKEGFWLPWKTPIKSLMTLITISICFFIPLLLLTLWLNYDELQSKWQDQSSIAIFLPSKIDLKEAGIFLQEIKENQVVASAILINEQEIKKLLNTDEQLSKIIDLVSSQDLPKQISIKLNNKANLTEIDAFIDNLSINPQVEYASYDKQWLNQLEVLTHTLLQMARISALMFIIIIMVILANTLTSEITAHKNELRLLELIGATWAQVRRKFLYMGIFYGVFAGLLAVLFLSLSLWWLQDILSTLVSNFGIDLLVHNLSAQQIVLVLVTVVVITWLTARVVLSVQILNQLD